MRRGGENGSNVCLRELIKFRGEVKDFNEIRRRGFNLINIVDQAWLAQSGS